MSNSAPTPTPTPTPTPFLSSTDASSLMQSCLPLPSTPATSPSTTTVTDAVTFSRQFSISDTVSFLSHHVCTRVALQFPDELLHQSVAVVEALQQATKEFPSLPRFFILADTSYGSCCCDEVAAEHVTADALIHYGYTCLSRTRKLPVYHVLGWREMDVEKVVQECITSPLLAPAPTESEDDDTSSPSTSTSTSTSTPSSLPPTSCIIFYHLHYAWTAAALADRLHAACKDAGIIDRSFIVTKIQPHVQPLEPIKTAPSTTTTTSSTTTTTTTANETATPTTAASASTETSIATSTETSTSTATPASITSLPDSTSSSVSTSSIDAITTALSSASLSSSPSTTHYSLLGYQFDLPSHTPLSSYTMIYISDDTDTTRDDSILTQLQLNYNSCLFFRYSTSSHTLSASTIHVNRTLARRYYLMQKARNAQIFGIVVGTLGVANYLDVIKQIKKTIQNAGKRSYLFLVGKINEPKLSNFAEIDLYVVVACPHNSLIDTSHYYRDIITPYELEMALTPGRDWTGVYSSDFHDILPSGRMANETTSSIEHDDDGDREAGVRYDAVTGKMKAIESVASTISSSSNSALVHVSPSAWSLTISNTRSARDVMAERSYRGLDLEYNNEGPAPIEQGMSGIARAYDTETEKIKAQTRS